MHAQQLLKEGNLPEALAALQADIRRQPGEPRLRIFLFQLLCVLGQWERALAQLQVLGELDAATLPMVQTYRAALRCELLRQQVFAGRRAPVVLGDPLPWMVLLIDALRLQAEGQADQAAGNRERAFGLAPAMPGSLDGERFAWIGDADGRIGPFMEAFIDGRYLWLPFQRMRRVEIEPPSDLRDLVWIPASFCWTNGGQTVGLVPARYVDTVTVDDARLLLAQRTDWLPAPDGAGLGQRLLATDRDDVGLLNVRRIDFDDPGTEGAQETPVEQERPWPV